MREESHAEMEREADRKNECRSGSQTQKTARREGPESVGCKHAREHLLPVEFWEGIVERDE